MTKRLLTFGCSLTKYAYATWADFLSANFDEYYNFGRSGSCMSLIMDRIIEADINHNLNPETDYVVVMFTGIGRWTYMKNGGLETHGDLMVHAHNNPQRKEVVMYVENFWSDKWLVHKAWTAANAISKFLTYKNIKHKLLLGLDYEWYLNKPDCIDLADVDKVNDIINLTSGVESMHSFHMKIHNGSKHIPSSEFWKETNHHDGHPSQLVYYMFLQKYFPEFDNDLTKERYEYCQRIFMNDSQKLQDENFDKNFRQHYDKTYYHRPFGG